MRYRLTYDIEVPDDWEPKATNGEPVSHVEALFGASEPGGRYLQGCFVAYFPIDPKRGFRVLSRKARLITKRGSG